MIYLQLANGISKMDNFFSIGGTAIGPGFGIQKVNGKGYICFTCMTSLGIEITDDEVKTFCKYDLSEIKEKLLKFREDESNYNKLDYYEIMFVSWVIYGCDYILDTPERDAIRAICAKQGSELIKIKE